jgi:hypothetical protein
MDLREKLRKAAGLFVELPPEEPATEPGIEARDTESAARPSKTVEEIVRAADGPNLDEVKVSAPPAQPVVSGNGNVDFAAIYEAAALQPAPFTAEQMVDMLKALPPDLPLTTRRQMVQVTLSAMGKSIGVTPETIVTDASRKMAALTSYTETLTRQTKDATAAAEREIAQLESQIADRRQRVATAQAGLADVVKRCADETDQLDDVLEFFSLDIPPSKHAPPTS